MSRHLLAVDGSNMMARAWFTMKNPSLPELPEKIRLMLAGACRRWAPTHMVVALDSPDSFRRREIPGYKADREDSRKGPSTAEMTEALRPSFAAWNVATREVAEMEADDVIAALVRRAAEVNCAVSVLTKDTDLLQLVDDGLGVRVLWPEGKGEGERILDRDAVLEYFRAHKDFGIPVAPHQLLDLRTIAGGKDNLPRIEIRGEGIKPPFGFTTRRTAELLAGGFTLDSLLGPDRERLSDRERGWMDACREAALTRRGLLRLRSDLALTGPGSADVVEQKIGYTPAAAPSDSEPIPAAAPRAKPTAAECIDCQAPIPYDPVYAGRDRCGTCAIKAGRLEAEERRRARELVHA